MYKDLITDNTNSNGVDINLVIKKSEWPTQVYSEGTLYKRHFAFVARDAFQKNIKIFPQIYLKNRYGFEKAFNVFISTFHEIPIDKLKISFGSMPSLFFSIDSKGGYKLKIEIFFEELIARNIGNANEIVRDIYYNLHNNNMPYDSFREEGNEVNTNYETKFTWLCA